MIFKTIRQNFEDVYIAGKKINELNNLKLDATNITAYATALKGLNAKQAELVLSTQGLTLAQKQAILSQAELLGTTGKLTTAELEAILVTKKRNKDQAEALLINTGLITSETAEATATNVVTAAKLKELVATGKLTQAEANLIATKAGVTLANQKESASLLASIGAKIKGAGTALKGLGTGILTIAQAYPVIAGITVAITLLGGAALVNKVKQEKAAKAIKGAYEEAKNAIDEINNTFSTNSSQVKEISKEYAELAQGVNLLTNANKSLPTEKHERFLELSNQLSKLYPSLTKSFDENGNAILDLSGDVNTIVGSLDDLIERQRVLANQEIMEKMPDLFAGYSNNVSEYKDQLEDAEKAKDGIQKAYEEINKYGLYTAFDTNGNAKDENGDFVALKIGQYIDLLEKLGITAKQVNLKDSLGQIVGYKLELEDGGDIPNLSGIKDAYVSAFSKASDDVKYAEQQFEAETSSINQYLNTWLQTEFSYNQIEDSGLQKAIQETIFNFDWDLLPDGIDKSDWEAVSEYLRRNILFSINNIDDADISKALSDIYSGVLTSGELLTAISKVQEYFGSENPISISLQTRVNDIEPLVNNVKEKLQDDFDDKVGELTLEELQIAAEQVEVSDGTLLSWDELIAKIKEVQGSTSNFENPISLSISDTITQLNTQLKPAMDSLQSAWQDIFDNDGFAPNNIDILSTCDSIKSKLDEMKKTGLVVDYSAFEDFVRVLNNTESKEHDVETAFDSLATSITQAALSGAEDFETMKSALEDLGVVNNGMVAFGALINNTTALEKTISQAGLTMDKFVISTEDGTIVASEAAQAFIEEMVGAENCKQALALLQLQQMLCNENSLNTTDDVNACLTLAKAAGVAVESLSWLANVSAQYDAAEAAGDTVAMKNLEATMGMIRAKINDELASFTPVGVDFSGVGKGAKSAGKKAGKDYKDALKEELSDLEGIISGITGKIDDQISSINEQKSAALESIDAQKEALEEAKEAAVDALEAERDAQLAIIEEQKKALENQIEAKQDEIDAINEAADARKREIDLQKAQYELERMQNQRTMLVYSEDRGMHYRTDESGIRDAKETVDEAKRQIEIANLEKEKELLEDQVELLDERTDAINEYYDNLIKQTEKSYDAQIKALEQTRKETESYFESVIKNLESSKSKYEELTELLDKAELSAKIKQLGIDEEALLNGSEEEFNKLKDAYMNIVFQLNEGNGEVLNALRELSGYEGTAPTVLEESNNKLDTMNEELGTANTEVGNINSALDTTASTTGEVASNVESVSNSLNQMPESGKVSGFGKEFDTLAKSIGKVAKALGIGEGESVSTLFQAMSNLNILTPGSESEGIIGQFTLLKNAIIDVINTIGSSEAQTVGSLMSAIAQLNAITLDENIITQFNSLKTAVDEVVSAVSGGTGGEEGSSGEQTGGSAKGIRKSKGKGSKGKGGGGSSLTGAIEQIGDTAKKVIGKPDAEGDGTVIGEFGALETAVTDVTTAIGGDESESETSQDNGSGGNGEDDGTLTGSIVSLGKTSQETLGKSGGEGVIGRFEEFEGVIGDAKDHVKGIVNGLAEIDGKTAECTIKIHVESDGFLAYASGTALGAMNLESSEYNAKYTGNARVSGTANVTGNWGVRKGGKSLVGELGQELWIHSASGTFETVGDNGPEWIMAEKGDIIFNHLQTKELLDKGNIVKTGKAFANGTIQYSDGSVITPEGKAFRPPIPGERNYELMKAGEALIKKWKENGEEVLSNAYYDRQKQMEKWAKEITNNHVINNIANNNKPIITIGDINVTCPGVTEQQVAAQLGNVIRMELDKQFSGFHNYVDQQSRIR